MPRGPRTPTINNQPSRTKQEGRQDANVNYIVATYGRTGQWANVNPRTAKYGDFSEALELEKALDLVNRAEREFMTLPARVRALANNRPEQLLAMLADPETVKILEAAGLEVKKPEPEKPAEPASETPPES